MPTKNILIIYEFFYPAYKAGGIVQSLKNLVVMMSEHYNFYCITGGYDLNEKEPLQGIHLNSWNTITLEPNITCQVWYDDKQKINPFKLYRLMNDAQPNIIYINGFMSIPFLIHPLLAIRSTQLKKIKTVIAPRGMLQAGALEVKETKKKWYLRFIQKLKLTKNIFWHITSKDELNGVTAYFPIKEKNYQLLGNIPQIPVEQIVQTNKKSDSILLLYASIITEKKNLDYILESLQFCRQAIQLNIYGVIKEDAYWNTCKILIETLPPHITVSYKGDYKPHQIQEIIAQHDTMVLLSKGENFAHAIFEALGAGRPVISSDFTSWNNLITNNAGWNLPLNEPQLVAAKIDELALTDNTSWTTYCNGAHKLAKQYLAQQSFVKDYKTLFG